MPRLCAWIILWGRDNRTMDDLWLHEDVVMEGVELLGIDRLLFHQSPVAASTQPRMGLL
jgi:hypothetical protein